MQKILIATTNPSKTAEYSDLLKDLSLEVVSARDLNLVAPPETGTSLEENARIKARSYHQQSGLPVIADDGGFEIEALGGRPGIYGHRWVNGTEDVTDEEIVAHTLEQMKNVPDEKRSARMRIVVVCIDLDGREHLSEGSIDGVITRELHHYTPGFPYRGIFFLPELNKMYGELSPDEHATIGHRQIAFKKLLPILQTIVGR